MRVLLSVLAISISVISLTLAECGSPSATIPAPPPVERPTPGTIPEAESVAFCDLVSSPQLYNQKMVTTRAVAAVMTSEVGFLYDPKCNSKDAWMDYEYENDQASEVTNAFLRRNGGKNEARRANVTIVGRFDGPSKTGYGHLSTLRFHFLIMAVEKAEAVRPDVPWPLDVKK